jgi:N utilization substance protein A
LVGLFAVEAPEVQSGAVVVKAVAREAGARSKIAVHATDPHIDPVGSMVGQRGVRVSTVMSELGGEKIDIIEWSPDPLLFVEDALSPAEAIGVKVVTEPNPETNERGHAIVEVTNDQQSLAIGRGGQNVRLAAKLTGWKIDIVSAQTGDSLAEADTNGETVIEAPSDAPIVIEDDILENEDATTTEPLGQDDDEPITDRDSTPDSDEFNAVDTPEEAEALMNNEADGNEKKN